MKLSPERKLRFLSEYIGAYVDAWPNKVRPFDSWLDSTLAKRANRGHSEAQRHQRSACRYCKRPFDEVIIEKTKDHIVPVSKGGFDRKENRVPCCYECNQWKDDKSLETWLKEIQRLVKNKKFTVSYTLDMLGRMVGNIKAVMAEAKLNSSKISIYKVK